MSRHGLSFALVLGAVLVPASLRGQASAPRTPAISDLAGLDGQLDALVRRVAPSVVQVLAFGYASAPGALLARAGASGSGVIVDPEGWVVTNAHVLEGARGVRVDLLQPNLAGGSILRPRSRRLAARVVGLDRETDVAVLKVEQGGLPALPFGDSEALHQGQMVLAFGSPLGLENSVSLGVVSAVARQLRPDDPMIYVQTDASINPGNSGGPLVDVAGRMVGLNTMILSQSGGNEGIGLAAPGNIVRSVYEQIRRGGRVHRGVIGVRAQTITPPLATGLGLVFDRGVVLSDVLPSGPGVEAGLRPGDVVVALDGKPMENARQLDVNLYRRAPGETVTLSVRRGPQSLEVPVRVVERPEDPDRFLSLVTPERNLVPRLGVLALELDGDLRRSLGPLRGAEGVLVAARSGGSPGAEDDLRPGDVVYAVNGVSVRGLAELRSAVTRVAPGEPVVLHVERAGKLVYVVVESE
ncbi:MAG TPA: trypsin-like peptidase domain-containing protein [Vicinamibacteria bacterium]|jgi:serine protease Do|nr:trypsin-like peptidase domain-containing protein [Vicinamibacteria bacterium]